jgi:cytochrome c oxidase cbb3-type subunit III
MTMTTMTLMSGVKKSISTVIFLLGCIVLAACSRETRLLRQPPSGFSTLNAVQVSGLNPGLHPIPSPKAPSIYEESAYSVSEGQRLYEQYNCVGCHAHGGGGMGPPLMDNNWIYGSDPQNIFATIMQGRPNGMPSFRNRIPEYQVWEIVAYVRSLSGLLPADVAPNRTDEMQVKPAESSMPRQTPVGITGETQK